MTNLFSKFQPKFLHHLIMIDKECTWEIQQLLNNCWCCCVSFIGPKLYVIGHGGIEDWQENWRNYTLLHCIPLPPPSSPIYILGGRIPLAFHVNIFKVFSRVHLRLSQLHFAVPSIHLQFHSPAGEVSIKSRFQFVSSQIFQHFLPTCFKLQRQDLTQTAKFQIPETETCLRLNPASERI